MTVSIICCVTGLKEGEADSYGYGNYYITLNASVSRRLSSVDQDRKRGRASVKINQGKATKHRHQGSRGASLKSLPSLEGGKWSRATVTQLGCM